MYAVITAVISTNKVPTSKWKNFWRFKTTYVENGTIHTFETKEQAYDYMQQFLPITNTFVLPGTENGLGMYQSLWMGQHEECLHELFELNEKLTTSSIDEINWDYMLDEYQSLTDACEEFDVLEEEDRLDDEAKQSIEERGYTVTSYALTGSKLLGGRTSVGMMFNTDLEFDDLTEEEKLSVLEPAGNNPLNRTVDMGAMYDLEMTKKYNGNKRRAKAEAWYSYAKSELGMKKYRVEEFISRHYRTAVKAINTKRIKYGF